VIDQKTFLNAKVGDSFVGQNSLTWKVEAKIVEGGLLCKSPHSGKSEKISFVNGRIMDSEGWEIEEFNVDASYKYT